MFSTYNIDLVQLVIVVIVLVFESYLTYSQVARAIK